MFLRTHNSYFVFVRVVKMSCGIDLYVCEYICAYRM